MNVERASDVEEKLDEILKVVNDGFDHINQFRIISMRSYDSKAYAYARIWNLPDIWQKALDVSTFYIIEVLSQHYDELSEEEKEKILIHELLHIPRTFSGALLPHKHRGGKIDDRTVNKIHLRYKKKREELSL